MGRPKVFSASIPLKRKNSFPQRGDRTNTTKPSRCVGLTRGEHQRIEEEKTKSRTVRATKNGLRGSEAANTHRGLRQQRKEDET